LRLSTDLVLNAPKLAPRRERCHTLSRFLRRESDRDARCEAAESRRPGGAGLFRHERANCVPLVAGESPHNALPRTHIRRPMARPWLRCLPGLATVAQRTTDPRISQESPNSGMLISAVRQPSWRCERDGALAEVGVSLTIESARTLPSKPAIFSSSRAMPPAARDVTSLCAGHDQAQLVAGA
jgi:hypothetical protein